MKDIHQRLSEIKPNITSEAFRQNKGLGNEIGFHIFDYEPEYEILVRDYIHNLKRQIQRDHDELKIKAQKVIETSNFFENECEILYRRKMMNGSSMSIFVFFICKLLEDFIRDSLGINLPNISGLLGFIRGNLD